MAIYAIGDLQGCFDELVDLLNVINFDEHHDQLWFAGDIINRGPQSLECLEFILHRPGICKTILGNHDLHFVALSYGIRKPHKTDTLDALINHIDRNQFVTWYRQQPLLLHDEKSDFYIVHAGLPPQWNIEQAMSLAEETSRYLQSQHFEHFIKTMYGNQPDVWDENLDSFDKHRYIINCFTRLRYCDESGSLEFKEKGAPGSQKQHLFPWYSHPERKSLGSKIAFGHWSTVTLGTDKDFSKWNVYPLDTGCLWGGRLTALRLDDEKIFSVPSKQA